MVIRGVLNATTNPDRELARTVTSLAFYKFFHLHELLMDKNPIYLKAVHPNWGDVAINTQNDPSTLRVYLKWSKCDQFSQGVAIFIRGHNKLCPAAMVLTYLPVHGDYPGPLFININH